MGPPPGNWRSWACASCPTSRCGAGGEGGAGSREGPAAARASRAGGERGLRLRADVALGLERGLRALGPWHRPGVDIEPTPPSPRFPQGWTRPRLQAVLGDKTGAAMWEAASGVDRRRVQPPPARKSIGAEISWGVRFDTGSQAEAFVDKLAAEVWARMATAGVQGRHLTLKLKRRKEV